MTRPIGASYFSAYGTNHIIEARDRKMMGDHTAEILVESDYAKNSTNATITFKLEILDCYAESFISGDQFFKDSLVNKDEILRFSVKQYEQFPACNFDIDYTVTLFMKPLGSTSIVPFLKEWEGT